MYGQIQFNEEEEEKEVSYSEGVQSAVKLIGRVIEASRFVSRSDLFRWSLSGKGSPRGAEISERGVGFRTRESTKVEIVSVCRVYSHPQLKMGSATI